MTFCVGLHVREGLVALADTQIVRGGEVSSKAKLSLHEHDGRRLFIMTSGLRSVRDKVVLRLDDVLAGQDEPCRRLHQVVTAFGDELKAVRLEDGPSLEEGGLRFNLHAIIGGQLADDDEPALFMVYPQGNWVTATDDSPSFIIGRTSYGKPILDRLLEADTPLPQAVALAYLAFDATRASVVDVEFPIDVVVLSGGRLQQSRFEPEDLAEAHDFWHRRLRDALDDLPTAWAAPLWPTPDDGAVAGITSAPSGK
ncbi:MAG: proteasome-type protease [Ilumatobacteraceae bacterium]